MRAALSEIRVGSAETLLDNRDIEDLTINQPILSSGISGGKFRLFNPVGDYNSLILPFVPLKIWVWREGGTKTQLFGGRVVDPVNELDEDGRKYLVVIFEDRGWQLHSPPSLFTKSYAANVASGVIALQPNINGDEMDLTGAGDSPQYKCVDEGISDDLATYVYNDVDSTKKHGVFGLSDPNIPSGNVIDYVEVFARVRRYAIYTDVGNPTAQTSLRTGGTTYHGPESQTTNEWVEISTKYAVNPLTELAWTIGEVIGLQAGCRLEKLYNPVQWIYAICTRVWVKVKHHDPVNPTNGKAILIDAVSLCDELATAYIDPDSDITSCHSVSYEDEVPYAPVKEIMEKAETSGGGIGLDGYIDELGNARIFKRGKYASGIAIAWDKLKSYIYSRGDVHRVYNIIEVYGAASKTMPVDFDGITEVLDSAYGVWTQVAGTISRDTARFIQGLASIKISASDLYYAGMLFTFHSGQELNLKRRNGPRSLNFYVWMGNQYNGRVTMMLWDIDDNCLGRTYTVGKKGEWERVSVPCGWDNRREWGLSGENAETFKWDKLKRIRFDFWFTGAGSGDVNVDNLYFGEEMFHAAVEDPASQSAYKRRIHKPIFEKDLMSDEECLKLAMKKLAELRSPIKNLKSITVEGDYYKPGYMQPITVDDFDIVQRILEVNHMINGTTWDAQLVLGE